MKFVKLSAEKIMHVEGDIKCFTSHSRNSAYIGSVRFAGLWR